MRIFHFFRHEDHSGVSGTGVVAEGVEFTNGWCALRWLSQHSSIAFYQSLDEVKRIHGHGGRTELVMNEISAPVRPVAHSAEVEERREMVLGIVDEAAALMALEENPDADPEDYRSGIEDIRARLERLERKIRRADPR